MSNTQAAWQALRQSRHSPPGRASQGDRKLVYTAALEQAEQLLRAAATVGTASKPLLTFYSLSQAARAVAASASTLDDNTYPLSGHGIRATNLKAAAEAEGLASVQVCNQRSGAFVTVAGALKSSSLPAAVRFGDIWCLLPEAQKVILPGAGDGRSLRIERNFMAVTTPQSLEIIASGLPSKMGYQTNPHLVDSTQYESPDVATERQAVTEFLNQYPLLRGWSFSKELPHTVWDSLGPQGMSVPLTFAKDREVSDDVAISYISSNYESRQQFAFPSIGEPDLSADPFIIWWAVLHTLSMLARYQPKEWMSLISVDNSNSAVAVEFILERAVKILPELICHTINRAVALGQENSA